MPPDNYACYNTTFASAVITAKMLGQKTFEFMGKKVKVADHIKGVVSDLDRGKYKVVCRKPCGTHGV
mgnify:CR=1 FL=1